MNEHDNKSTERRILMLNGSPRDESISSTYRGLVEWSKKIMLDCADGKLDCDACVIQYKKIPSKLLGCQDCGNCVQGCHIKDGFRDILEGIEWATDVMIGTTVYLDMPTPQTVALLTRLNCMAESTNREFFRDKRVWLLATSYCSGTKTAIHTMMGACEMLGFTIPGRGTREYIQLWKDTKLRGGMSSKDGIWLPKE